VHQRGREGVAQGASTGCDGGSLCALFRARAEAYHFRLEPQVVLVRGQINGFTVTREMSPMSAPAIAACGSPFGA